MGRCDLKLQCNLYGDEEEKIITKLSELDVDENESRVFLHLLRVGPVRAGSITSALQYDRNSVYRVLVRLRNKGLVTSTFANPPLYCATNPEETIRTLLVRLEENFTRAKKTGHEIIQYLQKIKNNTEKDQYDLDTFTIIQGKRNVYARIARIIKNAKNPIFIVTTEEELVRMYHTAIPEEIESLSKKLDIRLILPKTDNVKDLMAKFTGAEIRCGTLPAQGIIVLEEGRQLIMSGNIHSNNVSGSDFSVLCTNNFGVISNLQYLCENLWSIAVQ